MWGTPLDGAGSLSLKQCHLLVYPSTNAPVAMPLVISIITLQTFIVGVQILPMFFFSLYF